MVRFAALRLFGRGIAGGFSALMALSLLATINAMVIIGPRVYYAMAKNGAFFAMAARVDKSRHTPTAAILCQGACAMLMTLTPFPQLVLYIGFALNFMAVMSVASLFVFRRRPAWQRLRRRQLSLAAGSGDLHRRRPMDDGVRADPRAEGLARRDDHHRPGRDRLSLPDPWIGRRTAGALARPAR